MPIFIIKILAFLFAVFVLVLVHEWGHFTVAKFFGVKILRFSIGFGKALWVFRSKKSDVEYVIAAVPLGGYVKMLDTREMEVEQSELSWAFDRKPLWQRMLIIFAGPATNIIFSVIVFWLVFVIGFTLPKPIIGQIVPDSIAAKAGLRAGDEIIAVADKSVENWQDVVFPLLAKIGETGTLKITTKTKATLSATQTYQLELATWKLDDLQPDPLKDLGMVPYEPKIPPVVKAVAAGSPASQIKLQPGDKLIAVNGIAIQSAQQFIEYSQNKANTKISLTVRRHNKVLNFTPILDWKFAGNLQKRGYLGVEFPMISWPEEQLRSYKYSVLTAVFPTLDQIWNFSAFNYIILGKLLTGKISLHILGGPISIFQSSASALQEGVIAYMGFLAILSLLLALINLMPIPGLDGGYFLFMLVELIRGKPISVAAQALILRVGLVLIILLMLTATVNDLMRMF